MKHALPLIVLASCGGEAYICLGNFADNYECAAEAVGDTYDGEAVTTTDGRRVPVVFADRLTGEGTILGEYNGQTIALLHDVSPWVFAHEIGHAERLSHEIFDPLEFDIMAPTWEGQTMTQQAADIMRRHIARARDAAAK